MGESSDSEQVGGRGGSGSSGAEHPSHDAKASNAKGKGPQSGASGDSANAKGDSSNNGDKGGSSDNKNVDGVLSQTLDENSNEWRNGSGNGLSGNSQGGGVGDAHFEPSTSFAEEDDDGVRPGDLYGKFTWKIENFSEISKRELRSNVFEVGEYKWYILVYPQGCDVSNHLSLFLCVADYDKLLPGWSHFAQFTIAVVNKDPKKSKYSDTLHRFCKKEHDWGWKKFMELSKVLDGFTVSDTLVIKAQVQVIREKQNRPFRCLDTQYRRELVRVYLTNVEGICRRFLEERREKLAKLRECPEAFHEFWDSLSIQLRSCLASDRADNILKLLVKRFFNEKEVTSTLVMDALHSGYRALQVGNDSAAGVAAAASAAGSGSGKGKGDGKGGKGGKGGSSSSSATSAAATAMKLASPTDPPVSISMEENLTYLAGDVMRTLEQAANEAVPPHNEDKDLDDYGKDSLERDERRLAELGKQAIEMFVLSHLYTNRIEVAFKENEALKRQEALIREEEEAERQEAERQAKKQEAERERRNRRKEKKQRKKERKEAEEAAAEAERVRLEQEKRKKDEEARKRREEQQEKERRQREAEREAARQAAKEKEAAKKAARKAALQKEEAEKKLRQQQEKEAQAARERTERAERERQAAEERERKLRQQREQEQREREEERERQEAKAKQQAQQPADALQEKDRVISDLAKKVESLESQLTQRDGTIAKLQAQLKQAAGALQALKERPQGGEGWQQVGSGSAPGTPEQQKHAHHQQRSPTQGGGSPGGVASAASSGDGALQQDALVSPIKAYAAGGQRGAFSQLPKGYQAGAGAPNGSAPPPLHGIPAVPNGMAQAYAQQHPAGSQQGKKAQGGGGSMVNGKAGEYGQHMMVQGGYRLAPVGQPVPNHSSGAPGGAHQQDNPGLDDFAHMGLITDLLE